MSVLKLIHHGSGTKTHDSKHDANYRESKMKGIYYHAGHGHLGWTLSAQTAQIVADKIDSNEGKSIISQDLFLHSSLNLLIRIYYWLISSLLQWEVIHGIRIKCGIFKIIEIIIEHPFSNLSEFPSPKALARPLTLS